MGLRNFLRCRKIKKAETVTGAAVVINGQVIKEDRRWCEFIVKDCGDGKVSKVDMLNFSEDTPELKGMYVKIVGENCWIDGEYVLKANKVDVYESKNGKQLYTVKINV